MRMLAVLCSVVLLTGVADRRPPAEGVPVPSALKKAIGCLVSAGYVRDYGLRPLGFKVGDWVWVRYHVGNVPEMGTTPHEFYIAIYARDGRRGELLEAIPNNRGGFEPVRNGYRLWRSDGKWMADEGQGGYQDYEAFGRLATNLAGQPRYRVQLIPDESGCNTEPN